MCRRLPRPGVRCVRPKSGVRDAVGHRSHVGFLGGDHCSEQRLGQMGWAHRREHHVVTRTVLELVPSHSGVADRLAIGELDHRDVGHRVAVGEVGVRDIDLLGGDHFRVAGVLAILMRIEAIAGWSAGPR